MALKKLKIDNKEGNELLDSKRIASDKTLTTRVDKVNEIIQNQDESFVIQIDTMNQLRNYKGKEGETITLRGYYKKGDKSPLNYRFNPQFTEDNGGSLVSGWVAMLGDFVYIEDFGVSEDNDDNTQCIVEALELGKELRCLPNKEYKVNQTINISFDVNINFTDNTVFYSIPDLSEGIKPTKIFHVQDANKVRISGIFDARYINNNVQIASPTSSVKSSSLISIVNCNSVFLESLNIQNFATNWLPISTLDNLISYGCVYIRDCNNVISTKCSLTTSRIEGFVFVGNKSVNITDFISYNNVSVWTPLHCFLNKSVKITNSKILQNTNSNGSTVNLYNSRTVVEDCYIENGSGIDFSFEVPIDISTYQIKPIYIRISKNEFINTSRIFYSLYHESEILKKNIYIHDNTHDFTSTSSLSEVSSLIRIDNAENVHIYNNINYKSLEFLVFFQTLGNIRNCYIYQNVTNSDTFVRMRQQSGWSIDGVFIERNTNTSQSLNSRLANSSSAPSCLVYLSKAVGVNTYKNINIRDNTTNAEGRVIFCNNEDGGAENIEISGNIHSSSIDSDVYILISRFENVKLIKNFSKSTIIFCIVSNVKGDVIVSANKEVSNSIKTKGMFNSFSGSVNSLIFEENIYDVPNPATYGIINEQSNFTSIKRRVGNNLPNVTALKTNVADTNFGPTINRPSNASIGKRYYDTTISKDIYWNGSLWTVVPTVSSAVSNVSSNKAIDLESALILINELKQKLNDKFKADRDSGQQATV